LYQKAVPGTICALICWERALAIIGYVYVDIARRYWTVCRLMFLTFVGQKIDQEAKEKLITEIDGNKHRPCPFCTRNVSLPFLEPIFGRYGAFLDHRRQPRCFTPSRRPIPPDVTVHAWLLVPG
jgi:hypothetical protein